jgi:hypothetical protein
LIWLCPPAVPVMPSGGVRGPARSRTRSITPRSFGIYTRFSLRVGVTTADIELAEPCCAITQRHACTQVGRAVVAASAQADLLIVARAAIGRGSARRAWARPPGSSLITPRVRFCWSGRGPRPTSPPFPRRHITLPRRTAEPAKPGHEARRHRAPAARPARGRGDGRRRRADRPGPQPGAGARAARPRARADRGGQGALTHCLRFRGL